MAKISPKIKLATINHDPTWLTHQNKVANHCPKAHSVKIKLFIKIKTRQLFELLYYNLF